MKATYKIHAESLQKHHPFQKLPDGIMENDYKMPIKLRIFIEIFIVS